ncbi:His-Xaa-Ser system protein HxsD [Pantoea agglomerans]|uniref:His-Xaa-Ser system protein HxsD n=1 Tax=Enterobacter agglomerans TaxID=549 RepID=UPI003C7DB832
MKKNISKNEYSECVLQSSLYWMSAVARWKFDESDEHWLVLFEDCNDEVKSELERRLNDFKFREKIQAKTGQVRTSIMDNVLRGIDSRLAE